MSRFGDISLGEMKIMVTNITALALIYFPTPPPPIFRKSTIPVSFLSSSQGSALIRIINFKLKKYVRTCVNELYFSK